MTKIKTFKKFDSYALSLLKTDRCYQINGVVSVERYRITIEKIKEPKETYRKRLQELWDECDSQHDYPFIEREAERLGVQIIKN